MIHQWEEALDAGLPGLWRVRKNRCWGIWSEEKGLILPCEYQEIQPFVNGYAIIKNGQFGYVDYRGNIISPCIWDAIVDEFDKEGHPALVFRKDGNYIDAPGEWVNCHNQYYYYFYYEKIPEYQIHPGNDGLYCPYGYFYLTPDGRILTPNGVFLTDDLFVDDLGSGWLEADPFTDGFALVRNQNSVSYESIEWNYSPNPWTLQNEKLYEEQAYLPDGRLHNGFQLVWVEPDNAGNCFRILNKDGNPVSPYRWSHVEELFEQDESPIRVYRRQWKNAESDGALDEDGSYYFPGNDPSFMQDATAGLSFHRGYYFLCADGAVITMSGCVKSEEEKELPDGWEWTEALFPFLPGENTFFPRACTIVNGHDITVALTGKFAIDENFGNDPCVEGSYNAIIPVNQEGLRHLMIRQGDRWGILHNRNEILTPCRWEEIRYTENHIYVRDNGLWGILDPVTGDLTEPCRLESIED